MAEKTFINRHIGPTEKELDHMLATIGVSTLDELIDQTIPPSIRLKDRMKLPAGQNEMQYTRHIKDIASKNKLFRSYIGMGYYGTITPGVIQRNILENPGWYTSYTPYQAEISQGRLEALLNFQTVITEMTGMEIANASLLDEATAAAEAMSMMYEVRSREAKKRNANQLFISESLFEQTKSVIKTRAEPLGIEVIEGNHSSFTFTDQVFGAIVQYTDAEGTIHNYESFVEKAHAHDTMVGVAADIMSLALLKPPGEWNADIVFGSTQRFGIPMGFGGPHAAYFATKETYKRNVPGRIIGVTIDAQENKALRMALQTREQHIKRERATSNICTAQALLANMAGMYAVYHGKDGIKAIAERIHNFTKLITRELEKLGYEQELTTFFDTIKIKLPDSVHLNEIKKPALQDGINFRYFVERKIGISIDETVDINDVNDIIRIFAVAAKKPFEPMQDCDCKTLPQVIPAEQERTTDFLTQEVFHKYHSETEIMRYMKRLENYDLALNRTMIPLGSCTMKLNAAIELFALSYHEFGGIHPFVPGDQCEGYTTLINELEKHLCEITGFEAISFQPNSGASGEHAGLMVIRKYHESQGEQHRNVTLIPSSAHGTNPASAVMAGMNVVVVKCDEQGNIDTEDLKIKAEKYRENLAAIMVTYPSTHGIFEENILEIIDIVHKNGGQVYLDGANMNAQVGLSNPAIIGADVCHLNLHKTFAIPHGGGGPGVGPIGVAKHLVDFLPKHPVVKTGGKDGIPAIAAAPFGSAFILPISYAYIKLLGEKGLTEATKYAILNANYLKSKLQKHYKILYAGRGGRVGHEFILDCNEFHRTVGIDVIDIAKRLMDYGFHAPTVAFPVHGTLMVEPTESEPLSELDRFCEAMIKIRQEIKEIEDQKADKTDNVLKNAPHTMKMIMDEKWEHSYTKRKAAFPTDTLFENKYWTPITRVNDAYGDRNLMCTCDPLESYQQE